MQDSFQVSGNNKEALFSLKVHRGDGMALLAMNWKKGKPPVDFVGWAIEFKEPGEKSFFPINNRVSFTASNGEVDPLKKSTLVAPIQKFRWVHFPRSAEKKGKFTYRVKPVFMNKEDRLSYGEPQIVDIELARETYPGKLNVTFTRGYVSSQAFVDRFGADSIPKLLPGKSNLGLGFKTAHPEAENALAWMGFEARHAILEVVEQAIADKSAKVRVLAYDLNEPVLVSKLEKLGRRLEIIIDNSGEHGHKDSSETKAAKRLEKTAQSVLRQKMGQLQHNKVIVAKGTKVNAAVMGSTNFSWRGFFVQANNAIIVRGKKAIAPFWEVFEAYTTNTDNAPGFGGTGSAEWIKLDLKDIDAKVSFSPHAANNALLDVIMDDISTKTTSSLFYSFAFLFQTPALEKVIQQVSKKNGLFVYGISDKKAGGIKLQKPDGNVVPVFPSTLAPRKTPEPFKSEPSGGGGNRMHHKFAVIDFDKPTARVYMGSYNFSSTADRKNGENLVLIKDRRVAVSYMIEALRLFDHYHFRVAQLEAKKAKKKLVLQKPPRKKTEKPWWLEDYTNARKIRDRELFA
ncbi:phospholipase D-like domain-containing protein [Paraflavitalea sp. CAU 1676]|uniref:phospholipase D-like domain-containing protein n=1 Tax=Paraflavitalea sp. CAU 1676 TaxID=3032598 RepID=UPI0023DB1906|nr:phospholipase D-like domain-containing protein [Paraflavitalea sp. CAU 1676]MDF2188016.1 phospholipase D-like domain-containing protein [Paraflavitalea sp. CAU 1676]